MQPSPPPPPGAGGPRAGAAWPLTLGDALEIGGGALIFLFSFAPFITSSTPTFLGPDRSEDWWNAWSLQIFMVPLTLFVVFAGLLLILFGLSRKFWPPERELLGFRPGQLAVGVALFAFLVLLGYALSRKTIYISFSWGGAIMLIGALAATVGAFLNHFGVGGLLPLPNLRKPAAPPAHPGQYGQPGQYPNDAYPGGYPTMGQPGEGYPPAGYGQPAAPPPPQSPPAPPAPQPPTQQ